MAITNFVWDRSIVGFADFVHLEGLDRDLPATVGSVDVDDHDLQDLLLVLLIFVHLEGWSQICRPWHGDDLRMEKKIYSWFCLFCSSGGFAARSAGHEDLLLVLLFLFIWKVMVEEKFKETVQKVSFSESIHEGFDPLEQESGFFFNMMYFEEAVTDCEWHEVEK
ncbi:hypothetical protein HHK36_014432 [Tetracentron sinense]|uniref:Uncharacterized protein n=1 Tax=Tetracentron sinense TaxID=13715 RepID=A0A834Y3V3_TETSI|nr:hypothetical protein HHK36_033163 [Tetracentron sinense]KAF8401128.1 hypothetical protein HHK36_014432 [Tetracentron sinense]